MDLVTPDLTTVTVIINFNAIIIIITFEGEGKVLLVTLLQSVEH